MNTKKLTAMSMLLATALVIFIIESQIPPLTAIPGVKMGLANIITLVTMVWYGRKEAFAVLILRIIIGGIFTGQTVGFIYSLCGGMICFVVMAVSIKFIDKDRLWIISALGAIGHNIGQITAAILLTKTIEIVYYLPALIISGIFTGIFTGIAAQSVINRKWRNN